MAIQKVSDLPILRQGDYNKVKPSLIEISYKISSDEAEGMSQYQSMAVTVAELANYILSAQTGDGVFSGNITFPNGFSLSGSVYLNQPIDDDIAETYVVSAKTGVVDTTAMLRYKVNSPTVEMNCNGFTVNTEGRAAVQVQADNVVVQPRAEFKSSVFVPQVDESSDDRCAVNLGYLRQAMPDIRSPFVLFETKYLDYDSPELSASGWINTASGRWLQQADFPNAYEHLFYDYTSSESRNLTVSYSGFSKSVVAKKAKDGHIVCNASKVSDLNNIYTNMQMAWAYVIDTERECFMLPRNSMFIKGCSGSTSDVGRYSPPIFPKHQHQIEYIIAGCNCSDNGGIGSSHDRDNPRSSRTTFNTLSLDDKIQVGDTVSPPAIQLYLYMYCS